MIKRSMILSFLLIALMGPGCGSALASGQTRAASQNAGPGGGNGGSGAGGVHGVVASGSLPFTGADLAVYACAGLAMAAGGIGLRRLAGRDSASAPR